MTDFNQQIAATLTVRVPLSATGSLADGAVSVVERIETVTDVVDADIRNVSPGLNDTTVDLSVRADLRVGDAEPGVDGTVRRELEDGVGVRCVERVEAVEPDGPPVMEVG